MNNIHLYKSFSAKNNNGFTLIEVLVASVILFSSIALVSMVYRGAFLSSEKANSHIVIAGVLPSVLANIRTSIRQQGNSNSTQISEKNTTWDVNYQWQAELVSNKGAPKKLDPVTHQLTTQPLKYKLWQVNLTLSYKNLTQQHQFNELSWSSD
ncbi:type II secretion system protein [Cognaticolwellia mytili]|uniref:type II secretion system protein n=1 Tax=Cognaticolwellia mytili TaxID=1888913 RepID=UPI001301CAC9|nr:prepilin-type N-terminal cleavage/methylation domain-containing protein [Cognaticolwellia mytili]